MYRASRRTVTLSLLALLAACGKPKSKFRTYDGPPITQISVNKGQPEGVYFIDRFNPRSQYHLSVGISYPNAEDAAYAQAFARSAGGDIFIHGRGPEGNAKAPKLRDWTAGCIAVKDEEIEEIYAMLRPGVPVVINA